MDEYRLDRKVSMAELSGERVRFGCTIKKCEGCHAGGSGVTIEAD